MLSLLGTFISFLGKIRRQRQTAYLEALWADSMWPCIELNGRWSEQIWMGNARPIRANAKAEGWS